MLTYYSNPLVNPMFMEMPQLGTQMAPMPIPQYTMPLTMVTSVGTMSQNPIVASVASATIESTQPVETALFSQI